MGLQHGFPTSFRCMLVIQLSLEICLGLRAAYCGLPKSQWFKVTFRSVVEKNEARLTCTNPPMNYDITVRKMNYNCKFRLHKFRIPILWCRELSQSCPGLLYGGHRYKKYICSIFSFLPYSRKIWWELNLAVWWSRLKLPNKTSANIILHAMCNDAMHAVVLLAPLGGPLPKLYM